MTETRQIVVPGEVVGSTESHAPGQNTWVEGREIRALRLGVKSVRGDRVNVIGLNGRYEPTRGDMVIGTAVELGPSNWYINIGAANDVGMHVNDVPWRVEFGETSKYIAIGETVLLKIVHVDEMKKAQVSMKDRQCRKLTGGLIWEVSPSKVPRIVGRNGSMIALLKDYTNVRIFVGQNGVVWLDGESADVKLALEALRKIEEEAHTTGLTDRMKAWLEERRPGAAERRRASGEAEAAEDETPVESGEEFRPRRERRERPRVERAAEEGEADLSRDRMERGSAQREGREGGAPRHERHHSERRAHHNEPHHGRAEQREREERRGPPREERGPPRRFEEREERRGPPREERPARRFEEPRGRGDAEERPMRRAEDERPARRFDDERRGPPRDDRPKSRFEDREERRPAVRRFEDEERPMRRAEDERPARRFDDERRGPPRDDRPKPRFEERTEERPRPRPRFEDDTREERPRPKPRFDDDAEERPAPRPRFDDDEEEDRPARRDGGDGGGERRGGSGRRRGGRGRGRGGRGERSD